TQVIDYYSCSSPGEFNRVNSSETCSCPGHNSNFAVKANLIFHWNLSSDLAFGLYWYGFPEIARKSSVFISVSSPECQSYGLPYLYVSQLAVSKIGHKSTATFELNHAVNGRRIHRYG